MNNLSHLIRKFNRFELKYMVPLKTAERFKHDLQAYLNPDDHGDRHGAYQISSLYFDSPDYRFYWEKVDGIKFRRKLRIRHYDRGEPLTEAAPVFVEIKQRHNRVTQKRRAELPYRLALNLCTQRQVPLFQVQDAPVIDEVTGMLWQYNLQPASLVSYSRQALVGIEYDIGLRVTFDTNLRYSRPENGLFSADEGSLLFPPEFAIVEIKANERIPYWLTEMVAAHNLNLMRVSKYCRSIELMQNFQNSMSPVFSLQV